MHKLARVQRDGIIYQMTVLKVMVEQGAENKQIHDYVQAVLYWTTGKLEKREIKRTYDSDGYRAFRQGIIQVIRTFIEVQTKEEYITWAVETKSFLNKCFPIQQQELSYEL